MKPEIRLSLKRIVISLTFALLGSAVCAVPASASGGSSLNNWYALTWDVRPSLYQVDKSNGNLTLISTAQSDTATGYAGPAGFDVDSTNNVGYFVPFSWDPSNVTALWKVDLTTGSFTQVGPSNATRTTALDMGINGDIWIAADILDGQGQGFGKIDTTTGVATYLTAGPDRISALATSADGVLYAFTYSNQVYTVNTSNYIFTLVGSTSTGVRAADFDSSGNIILQDWGGEVSSYNLSTNTETSLFSMTYLGNGIQGEAFGIGGPTDGRTMNQAIAGAPVPTDTSNQTNASPASATSTASQTTNSVKLFKFSFGTSKLTSKLKKSIKETVATAGSNATYEVVGVAGKLKGMPINYVQTLANNRALKFKNYLLSLGVNESAISTTTQIVEVRVSAKLKLTLIKPV